MVLHAVVRVPRDDVEVAREQLVVERRARVLQARRHELAVASVLAHEVGLPGDEVGRQLGLVPPPREVVLRERVAVGPPQLRPVAEPVRPVRQAPLAVQRLDVAVLLAQPLHEALEDVVVVEQLEPRLVVELVADDRRVPGVAFDDGTDDPFRMRAEDRVA